MQLTMFNDTTNGKNRKSIIDQTCEKWGFDVRKIEDDTKTLYAINDWLQALVGERSYKQTWTNIQKGYRNSLPFLLVNSKHEGKGQPINFTDKNGLFLITQALRPSSDRPIVIEIQQFLATSGEFADMLIMAKPDEAEQFFNTKMLEAYGDKEEKWIEARYKTTVKRNVLTAIVSEYVKNPQYGTLTDVEYMGLFDRTAKQLESQNGGVKPRDGMTEEGLGAVYLAEATIARLMKDRQAMTMKEAIAIFRQVTDAIHPTVVTLNNMLGVDIATGKKLLKS